MEDELEEGWKPIELSEKQTAELQGMSKVSCYSREEAERRAEALLAGGEFLPGEKSILRNMVFCENCGLSPERRSLLLDSLCRAFVKVAEDWKTLHNQYRLASSDEYRDALAAGATSIACIARLRSEICWRPSAEEEVNLANPPHRCFCGGMVIMRSREVNRLPLGMQEVGPGWHDQCTTETMINCSLCGLVYAFPPPPNIRIG